MALPRSAVRRLFIAAFLVLPLQYALVGLIGLWWSEPWPAIVMPGFQTVYRPDSIATDVYRFEVRFSDGSRVRATPIDVLAELPRSHHEAVLKAQFRTRAEGFSSADHRALADWLRVRLQQLYPSSDPARVTVVRDRVLVVSDPAEPRRTVTPLDSLTFALR